MTNFNLYCVIDYIIIKFWLFCLQIRKPLMEKRRRARINDCLNELKSMLLDADAELKQVRKVCIFIAIYLFVLFLIFLD